MRDKCAINCSKAMLKELKLRGHVPSAESKRHWTNCSQQPWDQVDENLVNGRPVESKQYAGGAQRGGISEIVEHEYPPSFC